MKRKDFFLFFFLPFAGIIIIFFIFSTLNRTFVQKKVEELVREQLQATAEILKFNISHFLEEGYSPEKIIELSGGEKEIYYLALLDEKKNIVGWSSRFEGYLPFSLQDTERKEPWIISSPAGKIFNLLSPFAPKNGQTYFLYLGYSLRNLEVMIERSNRNFLFVFGFLAVVGIVFFIGIFELQKSYLAKKKEAEEEKKEKERFREISAFTSAVAHEIKNPLNSLSLLFDLLQKKVPEEVRSEVMLGKTEVQKISQVIDQFADYLKPFRLNREKCALRDVVFAARESLQRELEKPGVEFSYVEESSIFLYADKNLLVRSFLNLLRNAYEATNKGAVSVEAEKRRKKIIIRITDTGKGIAPENSEHIFDPFFTTKNKGMGIGLYLAKKIIEAHEGRIEVKNKASQGTTFAIQIPGGHHE